MMVVAVTTSGGDKREREERAKKREFFVLSPSALELSEDKLQSVLLFRGLRRDGRDAKVKGP